jgi:molybdenum cofactor cytidylyltransferase
MAANPDALDRLRCVGVLLAAGRGRRMGGNKQWHLVATPTGPQPLVAAAFDSIASVSDAMFVVLGHRADEVAALLSQRTFVAVHSEAGAPMFHSLKLGLQAAWDFDREASVLLQLGDHPQVGAETLTTLFALASANPGRAILPEYQGKGGHPVLIPRTVIGEILSVECPGGLREYWLDHPDRCLRMAVLDASVICDIDQP